jgi:hypothetical protein
MDSDELACDVRWSATAVRGGFPHSCQKTLFQRLLEAEVLLTAIVFAVIIILWIATMFCGFHKTGARRVKLKAGWKSGLEFEIEGSEPPRPRGHRGSGGAAVTLLVGYASPEYVILASDRMTTWSVPQRVGGRTIYKEKYGEQITKTTFFGGQYLIA